MLVRVLQAADTGIELKSRFMGHTREEAGLGEEDHCAGVALLKERGSEQAGFPRERRLSWRPGQPRASSFLKKI